MICVSRPCLTLSPVPAARRPPCRNCKEIFRGQEKGWKEKDRKESSQEGQEGNQEEEVTTLRLEGFPNATTCKKRSSLLGRFFFFAPTFRRAHDRMKPLTHFWV